MNKIIILMFMLNNFVFGTDINSLIEQLENNEENEEVLYEILSLNQNMLHETLELENLEKCYLKDFAFQKNFKLTKEFAKALQIFIGERNSGHILPYEFLCKENLMKAIFRLSKDFKVLDLYPIEKSSIIRLNESKSVDILFDNEKLSIKKINFRYRNSNTKPIKLPRKKFFIFEFSANEKYLLAMST